jgi:type IV secretory pathway VirB10-like protein
MKSVLGRRLAAIAGGTAITAMVVLTASCAKEEEKAPETSTTTTTTTTPPAPSPTEKAPRLEPGGPNPFSPTVIAPGAPTAVPGNERNTR